MTQQLIDEYLGRLEAALGNEPEWRPVYNELLADKRIANRGCRDRLPVSGADCKEHGAAEGAPPCALPA